VSVAALREQEGRLLGEEWVTAWNAHDLATIMTLYSPDVVFQTPTAIATLGIPDGRIEGREALREHFARGLARLPDLRFDLERIYVGVRSIAIIYRWADGTPVAELHEYDDDSLIERVQALYVGLSW
jgi:ketosteroid isomerase-like protein